MVEIYRLMFLSRAVDDREILLKRQQKIFFQISAAGHEALQVGAALALRPGYDWFFPVLSRSRALPGAGRYALRHDAAGRGRGHRSGQRRAPDAHPLEQPPAAHRQHIFLDGDAVAPCRGLRRGRPVLQPQSRSRPRRPRATIAPSATWISTATKWFWPAIGEGSTSQGEFWEAINTASNQKLPVIFCVEDNGYAISVPVEVNTPGGNISRLVANFPNFYFAEVDGNDPVACLRAFQAGGGALPRGPRAGAGPRPLRAALLPLALRRRQELPLAPPSARPTPCAIPSPECARG